MFALLNNYSRMSKRKVGYYIIDLPVSTPIANAVGIDIWGYPKFVTDIPFALNGREFSSEVLDPETKGPILKIQGKIGWGFSIPPFSLLLYSSVGGENIKTDVNIRGWVNFGSGRRCKLEIGDSKHRMAQHLKDLGLQGKSPIMMMRTDKFQSRLNDASIIK